MSSVTADMTRMSICIINYGMGNVGSVQSALAALGVSSFLASERHEVADADGYILPGVGAFGEAMANLRRLDLIQPLHEQVLERRKPFLGICLGMQLLADTSTELGAHRGLGWVAGDVVAMPAAPAVRVPHVGWSELSFTAKDALWARLPQDASFYFDHSFHFAVHDRTAVIATARSGIEFAAAVRKENILAVQFHPEKSQRNGLKLLRNFTNFCAVRQAA